MFSPGLAEALPTNLDLVVGKSMTIPIGPTKGENQAIEVDLGEADSFISFDSE